MGDFCDWCLLELGFSQEWGSLEIGGLLWDGGPSGLEPLGAGGVPGDRGLTFRKEEDGKVPKVVETPAPGCC